MPTPIYLNWRDEINIFPDLVQNATTVVVPNYDGLTSTVFTGTFTVDGSGRVTGGPISSMSLVVNSDQTVLQTVTNNLGDISTLNTWANEVFSFRADIPWFDVIDQHPKPQIFTLTEIKLLNTDGTFTDILGTGLGQQGGNGAGFTGTVTSVLHLASDGTTVLVGDSLTGLNVGLNVVVAAINNEGASSQTYSLATQGDNTMTGLVGHVTGTDINYVGLDSSGGTDAMNGNANVSLVSYSTAQSGVVVNLLTGTVTGGDTDTLNSFINGVGGSEFNDTLTANNNSDFLRGGIGNDSLIGGTGNDSLNGGPGNDFLDGGTGTNTADYGLADAPSGVTVSLALGAGGGGGIAQITGGAGTDTLVNIQNLVGTSFNDVLTGDANNNFLTGGSGSDTLAGGLGIDTAVYSGNLADYAVSGNPNTILTITDTRAGSPDGTDTVTAVEFFQFADGTVSATTLGSGVTQPPVLANAGNTVAYTQGGAPVVLDGALTVSDTSSATLTGATVAISAGKLIGDQLNFTNQGTITGNYVAATGVLTLSGTASLAAYQTALDSITYSSTSANPTSSGTDPARTISWTASSDALSSSPVTSTVNVTALPLLAMDVVINGVMGHGAPEQGAQPFSQFLAFGDSSIDSGYFLTHPISNDSNRQAQYDKSVAAGGGLPTSLGGVMNSVLLAGDYGLTAIPIGEPGGTNYAASGATAGPPLLNSLAPTIPSQIQSYLASIGGVADSNAIYLIAGGGNDIKNAKLLSGTAAQDNYIITQANSLAAAMEDLYAAGARHIVEGDVLTSDPLGQLFTATLWSDLAEAGVPFIPGQYGANVSHAVTVDPSLYGIANTTRPPVGPFTVSNPYDPANGGADINPVPSLFSLSWALFATSMVSPNAGQTYLWADNEHLSAAGQQIKADYLYNLIQNTVPTVSETLTASANLVSNGSIGNAVTYQWQSLGSGQTIWQDITGATTSIYVVQQSDLGSQLRVEASLTDNTGQAITTVSPSTLAVVDSSLASGVDVSYRTVNGGEVYTVLAGHTDLGDYVLSGGTEIVASGGIAIHTTINSGGIQQIYSGGIAIDTTGNGSITFVGSGGTLAINTTTMPTNVISGFAVGDTIELKGVNFDSGGSATLGPGNNVLHIVEGGKTYDLNFDPAQNFSGQSFQLINDQGTTDVIVKVNVNHPPTTTPVTLVAIAEDSGGRLITQANLLVNASDVDGDSLTAANLQKTSGNGTLHDNLNGTWTYTPALNDDTSVTFSYNVTDGIATPVVTSATLDITPVNDAPIAIGETIGSISEDSGAVTLLASTLLANDTDADNHPASNTGLSINSASNPAGGTVSLNGTGNVVFTPTADFNGTASFVYNVKDTDGNVSNTVTANFTVSAVADIAADNVTVVQDSGANTFNLLANDSFANAARAITVVGLAGHGIASINNNSTPADTSDDFVVYTPNAGFSGSDNFTYTVSSGGVTETATVNVTVTPSGSGVTLTGGPGNDTFAGGAGNDTLSGLGGNDTLTGHGGNDMLLGGNGNDTFLYVVGDGSDNINGGANSDRLIITGTAGNDIVHVVASGNTLTSLEGGIISSVEHVTLNLLGGNDTLSYDGTTTNVTVNLATGNATGFDSISGVENVTGGSGNDSLTGNNNSNVLDGGAGNDFISGLGGNDTLFGGNGNDVLNGGSGGDLLIGGAGADTINVGPSNDNVQDIVRFTDASEFGDRVSGFDVTGNNTQVDKIQFTGALNTVYDDIVDDNVFQWVTGNGVNGGNTTANLNTTAEGLFLAGTNGEGVSNANLGNASAIAAEFNAEFNIVANAGQDAVLVVNDTNANSFAIWQYVENGVTPEIQTNELRLIGIFNGNGAVSSGNLDLA